MFTMKYILILTFLFSALAVVAQTSKIEKPLEPVTVCDVINDRAFYNGKTVAVIGRWLPTDEGFWLADDCVTQIKTGDYVWGNDVSLEYDSSAATALTQGFRLNKATVKKKIAEMKSRLKPSSEKIQWAVVYGRVETQEQLKTALAGDGKSIFGLGYGHLDGSPAQVVYRKDDLKVLPNK